MHWQGVLIALEGIDGSGLTTHSKLLVEALNELGYRAVYTKEPTHGPIGQVIREMLKSRPDPRVLALLFAADRIWHLVEDPSLPGNGVLGALRQGYIVVTDRYKYSSIAYQGKTVGFNWVRELNKHAPDPDILVYIKVEPEVAFERITSQRTYTEYYEILRELRENSAALDRVVEEARDAGIPTIIVNQTPHGRPLSIDETHQIILDNIKKYIISIAGEKRFNNNV